MYQVPGAGVRCRVSGAGLQVSGVRCHTCISGSLSLLQTRSVSPALAASPTSPTLGRRVGEVGGISYLVRKATSSDTPS